MFAAFSLIFVADTKITLVYNFVAPLNILTLKNYRNNSLYKNYDTLFFIRTVL